MKLNFYDIGFNAVYSMMSKQTKDDAEYNQIMGVILGVIFFSQPIFLLTLDLFILFSSEDFKPDINKTYVILYFVILLVLNYIYFLGGKRYLKIDKSLSKLSKRKRILYKSLSWLFMIGTFIGLFVILSIKY